MFVSRREEEVEVGCMNRDFRRGQGGIKVRGEVSVGQLKLLMVILREQNHSHRWLRSLYLVAKSEGDRTQL